MRVLLVDDHDLYRSGLRGLLDAQPDFEVIGEASSLVEARQLIDERHPDLVILDLGLPDGSGIELMNEALRKKPELKIVFLTIHTSDELAFTAIRSGAKGFLLKNIEASKLLAALRGMKRGELAVSRALLSRFVEEILFFLSPADSSGSSVHTILTPREMEVLAELTTGDGNQEIAERLSISENTLKVHVHNILNKLEMTSRQEAAEYARRHGLAKDKGEWRQDGIV